MSSAQITALPLEPKNPADKHEPLRSSSPNSTQAKLAVVILAAGQGTRMKSQLPKMLHEVAGRPLLEHVINAAKALGPQQIVVVTGHGADQIEDHFAKAGVVFARQHEQLGTAHAFRMAQPALEDFDGEIVVLYGDTPLMRAQTLRGALELHRSNQAGMTVITSELENPKGYGRILRDANGEVVRIVEHKSATEAQKLIKEWNSGMYVFSSKAFTLAAKIGDDNSAKEFYLTDILEKYRQVGDKALAYKIADAAELEGANDRVQLAQADTVLRNRIREHWMREGVTLRDPNSIYIDDTVTLEPDVIIEPGVILKGQTSIARDSIVGAYSVISDSMLANNVTVKPHTVLENVTMHSGSDAGPFARLRGGAILERDVHVGNFVEIKNSRLEQGAKAGHLAYLGDARIGAESNIGAGTITANYDGINKHHTDIGRGVFIGSNSTIIAPRVIGDGAFVAGGSTISDDIPEGAIAIARGKQRNIEGWAEKYWRKALELVKPGKMKVIRVWLEGKD
jgi:bifunctional UDP-N-acetylglucosamine pyrophosphorylase / glucosamine-1-phosphate N-acetyltransferase